MRRHFSDPLYRNGTYLMMNGALGALLGFGFWWMAARVFDARSVGFGAGVISAMTLVALFAKFGFDAALIRYVPRVSSDEGLRILARTLLISGAVAFTTGALVAWFAPIALPSLRPLHSLAGVLVFAGGAMVLALAWILDAFFVATRDARFSFYRNVVFNGSRITIPAFIAPLAPLFGLPLAWSLAVALSLLLAFAIPRAAARAAPAARPESSAGFARFATVNAAVAVGDFLAILAIPVVVLEVAGAEANARFYVAWTIMSLAILFSKAIAQSAFAELASGAPLRAIVGKAVRHHAVVLTPLLIGTLLAGRAVLGAFGESYAAAYPVLVILAPSALGVAVTNIYVTLLRHEGALVELAVLPVSLGIASVAVTPFLVAQGGLVAVALGWLVVTTIGGAWGGFGLRRRLATPSGAAS